MSNTPTSNTSTAKPAKKAKEPLSPIQVAARIEALLKPLTAEQRAKVLDIVK